MSFNHFLAKLRLKSKSANFIFYLMVEKFLQCLRHESIEMDSQLWFVGCEELDAEDGVDGRTLVDRHDLERLLQPVKSLIFPETVGSDKMENESLDPFGEPPVVQ